MRSKGTVLSRNTKSWLEKRVLDHHTKP